jgi:uncharacterized protein (TIGR00299 family) protein
MKTIYLDGSSGMSGNMFLGGLLDLGLPEDYLRQELSRLPVHLPEITITRVNRKGIQAVHVDVHEVHEHHHRHLSDISKIIMDAGLKPKITENALRVFTNLAEAEAKIHGVTVQEIHFHEVGALDAIIDIVGACIGLEYFGIHELQVSPLRVGSGTIQCAHGQIPLPAPATLELLKGFTVFGGDLPGEWTTPTGAVIIKTFGTGVDSVPSLRVLHSGYGAGTRDCPIPNVVRLIIGEATSRGRGANGDLPAAGIENDTQFILETNIDDMNPEILGFVGDLLLKTGALDYYYTPVQMKKGRPGILLTVVAPFDKVTELENVIFQETSTLGIRKYTVERRCLMRDLRSVTVRGIPVRVKIAFLHGELLKFAPEYDDCLQVSRDLGCPLREIYEEAIFQARKILQNEGAF